MRYRKLRIGWSAMCLVACVLLVAMWVRSYWWVDGVNGQLTDNYAIAIGSMPGCIGVGVLLIPARPSLASWTLTSIETNAWFDSARPLGSFVPSPMWGTFFADRSSVFTPYWFANLLCVAAASVPWVPWSQQFSLRALLLAMTLVSVALGLIAWLR